MKRLLALLMLLVLPAAPDSQVGVVLTLATGTAQRFVSATGRPVLANSLLIQALHGGSNIVYVLNANPSATCVLNGAGTTLVAELYPATATAPGGSYSFPTNGAATSSEGGFDIRWYCVQGTSSDTVAASWTPRS